MTALVVVLAALFTVVFFRLTAGLATAFYGDVLPDPVHAIYRRLQWPGSTPRWILRREVAIGLAAAVLVAIEWVSFEALTGDVSKLTQLDRSLFLVHMLVSAGWLGYLISIIRQEPYEEDPNQI